MTVGLELARAREQKHLSRHELAKRTKLSVQSIAAIEEGDIDRLDMLCLRGSVSAFAAAVGLDAEVTSERYMAQLTHHSALDEFASEESPGLEAIRATAADPRDDFLPEVPGDFPAEIPPVVDIAGPEGPAYKEGPTHAGRDIASRLWAAWAKPASLTYATLAAVTLITVTTGLWFLIAPPRPGNDVALHVPSLPHAITVDVMPPVEKTTPPNSRKAGELTGMWMLTSNVDRSTRNVFNDLKLGFRLQLDQTGNRIRGQGHKLTENGRRVAARARTPIIVEGTIDNGRLVLTFTERGSRRTSNGTFDLQRANDGSLHGRFSTDAAQSSGRVQAVRLSSQP